MRPALLGVLAFDEGIEDADVLRDRAMVGRLARCKKMPDFRPGQAIGRVPERALTGRCRRPIR